MNRSQAVPGFAGSSLPGRRGLPRVPRGYVPPLALTELAEAGLPALLVVQAPRGFGKTVGVSWLLRQDEDPRHDHVWVNLAAEELDAVQFWRTVWRRLQDTGVISRTWAQLDNELRRRSHRLVLVVDDFDRVASTEVDHQLAWLSAQYESVHVIVVARGVRGIVGLVPLLDGTVIGGPDLLMTASITREVAAGLDHELTHEQAAGLSAGLLGWPSIVRTALAGPIRVVDGVIEPDPGRVERLLRAYVELLAHEARYALYRLSVPLEQREGLISHLGAPVWRQSLLGLPAELGEDTERKDRPPQFPEPMRVSVRRIFAEDDPAAFAETNRVVAHWYADRGEPVLALEHAVAGADIELLEVVLREHWAMLLADHAATARRALAMLPASVVRSDAALLVAHEYVLDSSSDQRAVAAYSAGLLVPGGSTKGRLQPRLLTRTVLSLRGAGFFIPGSAPEDVRSGAERLGADDIEASVAALMPRLLLEWAVTTYLSEPTARAVYAFVEAAEWASHLGQRIAQGAAAAGAALAHVSIGNPVAAQQWLDHLDSLPPAQVGSFEPVARQCAADLIAMHAVSGADTCGEVVIEPRLADLEAWRLRLRASRAVMSGRAEEAVRMLASYQVRPAANGSTGVVEHAVVVGTVEALLATNQIERVRRLLLEIDPKGERHPFCWVLTDFQTGEYDQVLAREPIGTLLPAQTVSVAALRAAALLRKQQPGAALDAFQTAIAAAAYTGLIRPFTMLPRADLETLAGADPHTRALLAPVLASPPWLPDPQQGSGLSPRELQVLAVVATGASFAAVASRLFVSPNTVKSQMRDVYRKLGVRGRDQAVERARELGLLQR